MIVLHAGFLKDRLHIWGEVSSTPGVSKKKKQARKKRVPVWSPFNLTEELLVDVSREVDLSLDAGEAVSVVAWLPSSKDIPVPSSPMLLGEAWEPKGNVVLGPWKVSAIPLSPEQAIHLLTSCLGKTMLAPGVLVGDDLQYWSKALYFAAALVTREQFLPGLIERNDEFRACWKPVFVGEESGRLMLLAGKMPSSCRALSVDEQPEEAAVHVLSSVLEIFVDHLVRQAWGEKNVGQLRPTVFASVHDQWFHALRASNGAMTGPWADMAHLNEQIEIWQRPISLSAQTPFRLAFRLEEPDMFSGDTDKWSVRFLLQATDDPSLQIDVDKAWNPDKKIKTLFEKGHFRSHEYLLVSLGQATSLFPMMEESLKRPRPAGCMLDTSQAFMFLTETAWLLRQAGFGVLLPAWWTRKGTRRRLAAQATVKSPKMQAGGGLTLDTIVHFDWHVALGDERLTQEEIEALARLKLPLVQLRGQWVQVDLDTIQSVLDYWKKAGAGETTIRDVVRMALGMAEAPGGLPFEGVEATGWVGDLLRQLDDGAAVEELEVPDSFCGTLRPYQVRGYSWMAFHKRWGFGACLADDMGLGKTIQALALIQRSREMNGKRPVLLVCPTSVMGNWQKESARFTPELPVMLHHGAQRTKTVASFKKEVKEQAIVITGYPLLHRDFDVLKKISWSAVILDEAQNIKNSETKQAKAARSLNADYRIALTGTPVENNVGELWSIMEFLNPGFLGKLADFKRQFFVPIQTERDPEAMQQLKRLTGPFVLRRLKTDKSIIDDLPEKLEMNVFTTLTKEQVSLYEAVVKEMTEALESSEGIQRKGQVLATLMKLKQICNHPAQFLHDESEIEGRSGKLARLVEMLEEVLEVGERTLIFTQFTEMGEIIRRQLQERFGYEALFLHGGVSKKKRDAMVERFQEQEDGPPFFLLSLKAGGTGLNLTRANHVFHFDRWWNPAVENQATDRAFRIGQTRQVQVHKFVCLGTVEERIDEMIERKREIAESVVGAGEGWITELSTNELKQLFELRAEAVGG